MTDPTPAQLAEIAERHHWNCTEPTDIPRLIAEIKRLRKTIDARDWRQDRD